MWFGLAKMAISTGAKVYANKQRQKEAMSQAALHTAEKMASGEIEYQGKLLVARQSDLKDEFVLTDYQFVCYLHLNKIGNCYFLVELLDIYLKSYTEY